VETDRLCSTQRRPIHHTTRTCVGCRRRDDRSALLRVVAEMRTAEQGHDVLVLRPDPRHRLPGRGAWLHPTPECLDQAVRRRAFGRALRVRAAVDTGAVTDWVADTHEQHAVTSSTQEQVVHETESGLRADEHPMSTQR